jgi:hypothetical protein
MPKATLPMPMPNRSDLLPSCPTAARCPVEPAGTMPPPAPLPLPLPPHSAVPAMLAMPAVPVKPAMPATAAGHRAGILAAAALLALLGGGALSSQLAARRLAESGQPLASLAAPLRSRAWDLSFWITQRAAGSDLWRRAAARCRSRAGAAYPNCTTVRLASWWAPQAPALPFALLLAPPPPLAEPVTESRPASPTPVAPLEVRR